MQLDSSTALVLIDIQKGMDDVAYWGGHRNNLFAEQNAAKALKLWRNRSWPVYHVKHNSTNPNSRLVAGQQGNEIKDIVKPFADELIIEKSVNSAFIGTHFQRELEEKAISQLVIAGLTTDHCVSSTVRMAANLGFTVLLLADATATFDKINFEGKRISAEAIHEAELASLHQEFATVINTDQLISNLKTQ